MNWEDKKNGHVLELHKEIDITFNKNNDYFIDCNKLW
jgi:hypothetical protein